MKNELFRKNSLDSFSCPEQLNECIKTSGTGIWAVFISAALIVAGLVVWAVVGTVDIRIGSVVVCENNKAVCFIPEKSIGDVSENSDISIDGKVYDLGEVSEIPCPANECLSPYGIHLANLGEDEWVYTAQIDADMENGIYKAEIVVESISPVSLLTD